MQLLSDLFLNDSNDIFSWSTYFSLVSHLIPNTKLISNFPPPHIIATALTVKYTQHQGDGKQLLCWDGHRTGPTTAAQPLAKASATELASCLLGAISHFSKAHSAGV